jgi:hypothetical protein
MGKMVGSAGVILVHRARLGDHGGWPHFDATNCYSAVALGKGKKKHTGHLTSPKSEFSSSARRTLNRFNFTMRFNKS